MKELSIAEKAKAYDEVIKKVNDYHEGKIKLYSDVDKTLDYLFPELKESEDERIRKFLIDMLKIDEKCYYKEIAWLEKQDTQDDDSNILQRFSFYSYKDEPDVLYLAGVFVNEDCRNKGIGTKILKVADETASIMGCQTIRLKTQKDTDAYKLYIKNGYKVLTDEGNQVWLEKHGEQKETLCDKCKKEQGFHSCSDITALGRCALEYQGEHKPCDTPKFHKGEWIAI